MANLDVSNATDFQQAILNQANPGDVVRLMHGDYISSNNGGGQEPRIFGGFTWGRSGTVNNPIRVTRHPNAVGMPRLSNRPIGSTTWVNWPTMTFGLQNHITVEWLEILGLLIARNESATVVNSVLVGGGVGVIVQHCWLRGGWEASGDGNWAALRFDRYGGSIVRNCLISDIVVDPGISPGSSTAAVKLFVGIGTLMEYCTVRGTQSSTNCGGIDDKDSAIGSTYRYNWCEDIPRGNRIQNQGASATNWKMHNNVIIPKANGCCFVHEEGNITDFEFYRNTLVMMLGTPISNDDGMVNSGGINGSGGKYHSNIVHGVTNQKNFTCYNTGTFGGANGLLNYNHYTNDKPVRYLPPGNPDYANMAAFRAVNPTLENSPETKFGDPMFVDAANKNFHLLPGSPCIGTGRVGGISSGAATNKGAYDDVIRAVGHGAYPPDGLTIS